MFQTLDILNIDFFFSFSPSPDRRNTRTIKFPIITKLLTGLHAKRAVYKLRKENCSYGFFLYLLLNNMDIQ